MHYRDINEVLRYQQPVLKISQPPRASADTKERRSPGWREDDNEQYGKVYIIYKTVSQLVFLRLEWRQSNTRTHTICLSVVANAKWPGLNGYCYRKSINLSHCSRNDEREHFHHKIEMDIEDNFPMRKLVLRLLDAGMCFGKWHRNAGCSRAGVKRKTIKEKLRTSFFFRANFKWVCC